MQSVKITKICFNLGYIPFTHSLRCRFVKIAVWCCPQFRKKKKSFWFQCCLLESSLDVRLYCLRLLSFSSAELNLKALAEMCIIRSVGSRVRNFLTYLWLNVKKFPSSNGEATTRKHSPRSILVFHDTRLLTCNELYLWQLAKAAQLGQAKFYHLELHFTVWLHVQFFTFTVNQTS